MGRARKILRLAPFLLLALLGCAPAKLPSVICLNKNLGFGAIEWQWEAAHRFKAPVVVACHGYAVFKTWWCWPDEGHPMHVETLARTLHLLYANRDVVLIVCNEGGIDISVDHVWYAKRIVWTTPRRFCFTDRKESIAVGRIEEFVTTTQPSQ